MASEKELLKFAKKMGWDKWSKEDLLKFAAFLFRLGQSSK